MSSSDRRHAEQVRAYDRTGSVVFLKTDEPFGGLSNMAGGFPLWVNGVRIRTSEALYQACRFPHRPEVQALIIEQKSPMTAKMKSKPYRHDSRPDWDQVRVKIMRWCMRVKLAQNWSAFSELLLETGDRPIVEESRKDTFWGAKATDDGTLVGMNVLGRLLMELREAVRVEGRDSLTSVQPVAIPDFLLGGRPIGIVTSEVPARDVESGAAAMAPARGETKSPTVKQASLFDAPAVKESPPAAYEAVRAKGVHVADHKPYADCKESGGGRRVTSAGSSVGTFPIVYDRTVMPDWPTLLGTFPADQFASPFRSTVPLLDMIRHHSERLADLVRSCTVSPQAYHLEYCVSGVAGGNPSQTDLMAIGSDGAVAVEAKWTEPRYETVATRLKRRVSMDESDNSEAAMVADRLVQERAVSAWIEILNRHAAKPLSLAAVDGVVYQVLHRAASACSVGAEPRLLYLHFHASGQVGGATTEDYRADLEQLYAAMGRPPHVRFYVAEQSIAALEPFTAIASLPKRHAATVAAVKAALLGPSLFNFGKCDVELVK
jgi:ribA/ribD-fused uncharacterized protein